MQRDIFIIRDLTMKRKRYSDVHYVGRSKRVPFIKEENWRSRHARRKAAALQEKDKVKIWCTENSFTMEVKNNGDHWIFLNPNRKSIQWFPSSGKLVIGEKWKQGIHVYDTVQLIEILKVCKEDKV